MVERLHRQLKAAIKCHGTNNWVEVLPIVLLGIRITIKEDLNATAAEMIYDTDIRLPAEFFIATKQQANTVDANRLKERMGKELETSPYVFLRHNAIGGPLQPQFDGPYKVIKRLEKNYIIRINDRDVTVSIDRLKPAFGVPDDVEEKTAESRDILIPVKQENSHEENSADNSRTSEENTRNRLLFVIFGKINPLHPGIEWDIFQLYTEHQKSSFLGSLIRASNLSTFVT
ncbi:uncharacterized protein LOC117216953 [Bombus bifarius]|uniref:Uncharacterized protein LOC117216953 n=1 Tax=Bombus bifarius TaxID=103933 RepID=A0A6P8P1M6_9HYME|nr:uncharacterized protein LOC117216953 [Bombus bifarius]